MQSQGWLEGLLKMLPRRLKKSGTAKEVGHAICVLDALP